MTALEKFLIEQLYFISCGDGAGYEDCECPEIAKESLKEAAEIKAFDIKVFEKEAEQRDLDLGLKPTLR